MLRAKDWQTIATHSFPPFQKLNSFSELQPVVHLQPFLLRLVFNAICIQMDAKRGRHGSLICYRTPDSFAPFQSNFHSPLGLITSHSTLTTHNLQYHTIMAPTSTRQLYQYIRPRSKNFQKIFSSHFFSSRKIIAMKI